MSSERKGATEGCGGEATIVWKYDGAGEFFVYSFSVKDVKGKMGKKVL
jgi:hypothetical protein